MKYIEFLNRFWQLDELYSFSPSETRLYFYLLKLANTAYWPDQFDIKDSKLCGNVGLAANTLKPARLRLISAGLLSVELSAPGLREGTSYQLILEGKASGKASIKQSKKASEKPSNSDALAESDEGKRQSNNQSNRQSNHQKLTLSYIYNELRPKTEDLNILSPASAESAIVRKLIQDQLNRKKKVKPPKVPAAPPINIPFELWWEAYDKRIDRKVCEPLWNRLTDGQRQEALTHTGRYVLETPNPKYRKNPQTYLNRESWHNEPQRYEPEPSPAGQNRIRASSTAGHASPEDRLSKINALFSAIESVAPDE